MFSSTCLLTYATERLSSMMASGLISHPITKSFQTKISALTKEDARIISWASRLVRVSRHSCNRSRGKTFLSSEGGYPRIELRCVSGERIEGESKQRVFVLWPVPLSRVLLFCRWFDEKTLEEIRCAKRVILGKVLAAAYTFLCGKVEKRSGWPKDSVSLLSW